MSDNRLKSLAARIERLMDERDGIQGDIRDIYAEAKSAGYVPKVLRKAITRKRMDQDKRSEEDAILGLYEDALSPKMRRAVEMAKGGASARQIETETGIDHVTVTRSVSLNKKSETHNPETGEITDPGAAHETDGVSTPTSGDAGNRGNAEHADLAQHAAISGGFASSHEGGESRASATSGLCDVGDTDEAPATPSVGAVASESERVAPQNLAQRMLGTFDDMPDQPPFLRRTAQGRGA